MRTHAQRMMTLVALLAVLATPGAALAGGGYNPPLVAMFETVLAPGAWQSFIIAPCSRYGAYFVEVTPLEPGADGAYVENNGVLPVFDGLNWNDVLTLGLPEGFPPLRVQVRVFSTARLAAIGEFDDVLAPGEWQGYILGEAALNRGLAIELTPNEDSVAGATLARKVLQPEFDGVQWHDVLRLQIPADQPALSVHVRIFETGPLPPVKTLEVALEPGVWLGFGLGPCDLPGPYLVELTPLEPTAAILARDTVQPEYDGSGWWDVLRIMLEADSPPVTARVTIYGVPRWFASPPEMAAAELPGFEVYLPLALR
jgi:hypothetical protein